MLKDLILFERFLAVGDSILNIILNIISSVATR